MLVQPRYAMSVLRGPLTRAELERAIAERRARTAEQGGSDEAARAA